MTLNLSKRVELLDYGTLDTVLQCTVCKGVTHYHNEQGRTEEELADQAEDMAKTHSDCMTYEQVCDWIFTNAPNWQESHKTTLDAFLWFCAMMDADDNIDAIRDTSRREWAEMIMDGVKIGNGPYKVAVDAERWLDNYYEWGRDEEGDLNAVNNCLRIKLIHHFIPQDRQEKLIRDLGVQGPDTEPGVD